MTMMSLVAVVALHTSKLLNAIKWYTTRYTTLCI